MSVGLIGLLDDIAAIAKVAAASLDDVASQAAKAGAKAAGVVIDDTAVTPGYVIGFEPKRELPIVGKIAAGSLRNKLLILLPAALALDALAPWMMTPLLMVGGLYLLYEGAEKVHGAVMPHKAHGHEEAIGAQPAASDAHTLEETRVAGAIKTDFILSAEIMVLTLASVTDANLFTQAVVVGLVGTLLTIAVYGVVALLVKADDVGVQLAAGSYSALLRGFGRALVVSMPGLMKGLALVGTAAMLWVGGGILIHGLAQYGHAGIEHRIHDLAAAASGATPIAAGLVEWAVTAASSGALGLIVGMAVIPLVGSVIGPLWRRAASAFA
jgi:predicted DNA repair protein MutK